MPGGWARLAVVGVLLLGLAGCTSGSVGSAPATARHGEAAGNAAPEEKAAAGRGGGGQVGTQPPDNRAPDDRALGAAEPERRVIRSAEVEVRQGDAAATAGRAREVGVRAGGFTAAEETRAHEARLTMRVPSDRLDGVLDELARLGDLVRREQRAEDVTDQLVDARSRIASQRASVERVRALLDRAGSVSEVAQVEAELARRQAELESWERRHESLSGRVALSTVVFRVTVPSAEGSGGGGFLGGLSTGWRAFTAASGAVLTALGASAPFLVVLGVPALGVLWALRRRRGRSLDLPLGRRRVDHVAEEAKAVAEA
ncbi:protein of unknown function (DUF4349) [Streptoalloteichus tenebrarius]|uniref:DUF4349 domain-containing protein n=1 Tax=Streptoalloteichus tenebrarius (strain ATCC 17920 / DSM 40477 / JCM 4838 / CBS 697.72 / NBRC 16177 / NCIMB 11028 / NRRL B-12390 / A12253. 1 / ISP 5477) TaxID=1933 RepID=A0ABT1I1T1_STRSD|nr:DUF4349 domain-containing protein [Streptoalloteichus tenebrarius]MCP2261700.1 protein of unknown function (DUF4349) [Streptoalloteichus tenebrarius]BFF02411.1 DUF4349 domain-containing protein [Streptoalloteichus tenebrarius]